LSYLRFTPDEYRTLRRLNPGAEPMHMPAFRRRLVAALNPVWPGLARKIARLRRGEMTLLYHHFQPRPADGAGHGLSPDELRVLGEACVSSPFPVRFVRPFKGLLVEMLEGSLPELARKVERMSGHQFERLYNQAVGRPS
jgi:hypothetical protein